MIQWKWRHDEYYEDGFWMVETDEDDDWDDGICSPSRCGDCWGGDGICMLEIERLAAEQEDFEQRYVQKDVACPHCGQALTQYEIPTTELWTWPGGFYNPMIALQIFAIYDAPKGEVHPPADGRFYRFHHIWVGTGEHRRECLIMLNREKEPTP